MREEVPSSDVFRPAVLAVLLDGEQASLQDIYSRAANEVRLSEEARTERLSSGQLRFHNRIGWAVSGLFTAGLLDRPSRGHYAITDNGRVVAQRRMSSYSEDQMLEWPQWREYQAEVQARRAERENRDSGAEPFDRTPTESSDDPLEVIASNVDQLNTVTESMLRRRLQSESPEFFENAVVALLWAMGYGGAHGSRQTVGRSGDGGIDGIIQQDPLGLRNVYVQAKRYSDGNPVGAPAVRDFFGAVAARGADNGVLITTSTFTPDAVQTAKSYQDKIVLIDGLRLTSLMLSYGVAVQPARQITIWEIDEDFFESPSTL